MQNLVYIKAAAIKKDNIIYSLKPPARHHNILQYIHDNLNIETIDIHGNNQGFLTSEDTYVTREEAAIIALVCGQIGVLETPPRLYSEDLWRGTYRKSEV